VRESGNHCNFIFHESTCNLGIGEIQTAIVGVSLSGADSNSQCFKFYSILFTAERKSTFTIVIPYFYIFYNLKGAQASIVVYVHVNGVEYVSVNFIMFIIAFKF